MLITAYNQEQFPNRALPQFAFIGRSNVGKSSLINLLTRQKICRISKKPGCTVSINFLDIQNKYYLVDLPGYGFAEVIHHVQKKWSAFIGAYFADNPYLKQVFVLIDARRGLMDSDRDVLALLGHYPTTILLTKIDKVHHNAIHEAVRQETGYNVLCISVKDNIGIQDLRHVIEGTYRASLATKDVDRG